MKQERNFKLYLDGKIKYWKKQEYKGCMELKPGHRAIKDGRFNINIPTDKKAYVLIQKPDINKVEKAERYSCKIDDWIEAINLVI